MTTFGLVLDCADPEVLADFWAAALGYVTLGSAGNYVLLVAADGNRPKLLLQRVPEAKTVKNRMHLDIVTPDIHGEAARLEALGARRLSVPDVVLWLSPRQPTARSAAPTRRAGMCRFKRRLAIRAPPHL